MTLKIMLTIIINDNKFSQSVSIFRTVHFVSVLFRLIIMCQRSHQSLPDWYFLPIVKSLEVYIHEMFNLRSKQLILLEEET